jgi:hypothetical protein
MQKEEEIILNQTEIIRYFNRILDEEELDCLKCGSTKDVEEFKCHGRCKMNLFIPDYVNDCYIDEVTNPLFCKKCIESFKICPGDDCNEKFCDKCFNCLWICQRCNKQDVYSLYYYDEDRYSCYQTTKYDAYIYEYVICLKCDEAKEMPLKIKNYKNDIVINTV